MMLCACPRSSFSRNPDIVTKVSFAYVTWPFRSVLLTMISSSGKKRSTVVGTMLGSRMRCLLPCGLLVSAPGLFLSFDDRALDGCRDILHLRDRFADRVDGVCGASDLFSHRRYLLPDAVRGDSRLLRQVLYFLGDYVKPPARFAGAARLDFRVEGEQLGLPGDLRNRFRYIADSRRCLAQSLYDRNGIRRFAHRSLRHRRRIGNELFNLFQRSRISRHFLGRFVDELRFV